MPIVYFDTTYARRMRPFPHYVRYCEMDDFTPEIFAAGGDWSELEYGINRAIVRARVPNSLANTLKKRFTELSEAEALSRALILPTKPRYDVLTDSLVFDGPQRKTKDFASLVREIPTTAPSGRTTLLGMWLGIGFGLGWRLPQEVAYWCAEHGLEPGKWNDLLDQVSREYGPAAARVYEALLQTGARLMGAFPTTSLLDAFARPDSGDLGSAWTTPVQTGSLTPDIVSQQVAPPQTNANADAYWNGSTFGPDTEFFFDMPVAPAGAQGMYFWGMLRLVNPGSVPDAYAGVAHTDFTGSGDPYNYMTRMDEGVNTQLGDSISQTWANGDAFGCEMIGDVLASYVKPSGGSWSQIATHTDSTYTAAGYISVGIYEYNATSLRLDNYGGGTVVAGGAAARWPNRATRPRAFTPGLAR